MAVQRGHELHVFDRVTGGPKPDLVRELGGVYHGGDLAAVADLAPNVYGDTRRVSGGAGHDAAVGPQRDCLPDRAFVSGAAARSGCGGLNRSLVLQANVVFGSVNANRAHYEIGGGGAREANPRWLMKMITRRVPLDRWREAYERRPEDMKVVIDFRLSGRLMPGRIRGLRPDW